LSLDLMMKRLALLGAAGSCLSLLGIAIVIWHGGDSSHTVWIDTKGYVAFQTIAGTSGRFSQLGWTLFATGLVVALGCATVAVRLR
jgi:drug/metabolite transporter (DMT)-like permease